MTTESAKKAWETRRKSQAINELLNADEKIILIKALYDYIDQSEDIEDAHLIQVAMQLRERIK